MSTVGYLENRMTGFYQCVLVGLTQVYKNCTMYAETNAACGSAENEATVHCVLLNLYT